MAIAVTPRALAVLSRALEAGRMDPSRIGIRVTEGRGAGGEARTGFADEAGTDEVTVVMGGITLYVSAALAERGATIDVSDEHDKIVVR